MYWFEISKVFASVNTDGTWWVLWSGLMSVAFCIGPLLITIVNEFFDELEMDEWWAKDEKKVLNLVHDIEVVEKLSNWIKEQKAKKPLPVMVRVPIYRMLEVVKYDEPVVLPSIFEWNRGYEFA